MTNIETKWIMDFLKLAELRNFSKAAAERNVTQSAFSRRIQSLENAVGCLLVNRDTTPVSLTSNGIEFRTSARSILIQLEDELERLNDLTVLGNQKVSLVAGHSIATDILPLMRFNLFTEEKAVVLDVRAIDIDDAVSMLQESACDLMLSYKNPQLHTESYVAHRLGQSRIYCVTGVDQSSEPIYRLSRESITPWVMHSSGSFMGRLTKEVSNQYKLKPIFSSSMTELVKELVLQGEGIGWLPEHSIRKQLESGQLVVIDELDSDSTMIAEIYAYRSQAKLPPAAERVWQKLCEFSNVEW
ncbi:LysR substrate-binding domain-containing protein [Vibrio sp. WJH972]